MLPSHGRSVVRYRQVLDEALGLDARQCAILAVLLLRGPQTIGELRIRTERMAQFDSLDEIEHELDLLASRDEPLAANVGRRPGQKEERWATLARSPAPVPRPRSSTATPATDSSQRQRTASDRDRSICRAEVERAQVRGRPDLRQELAGTAEQPRRLTYRGVT